MGFSSRKGKMEVRMEKYSEVAIWYGINFKANNKGPYVNMTFVKNGLDGCHPCGRKKVEIAHFEL